MPRRRSSIPSPLNLTPATVPLRRGQPKFVLPAAPSSKAIHISTYHRLKRSDASQVVVLRPLPGLAIPDGVYSYAGPASSADTESSASSSSPSSPLTELTLQQSVHHRQGHHQRKDSDLSSVDSIMTASSSSSSSTSSALSSCPAPWSGPHRPWTGPNAALPQIKRW